MAAAPPKARARAAAKASEDDGRREPGPPEAWLFDVVRGKAVCETGDEILAVWESIANDPNVEVVRVKNRCAAPKFNGYRDFLINLRVRVGGGGCGGGGGGVSKSGEMRPPARATA